MAQRVKARADEIAAISDAIGILNDDDALDVFKKSTASASFAQVAKIGLLQQSTHRASKSKKAQSILAHIASQYKHPTLKLILYTLNSKLKLKQKNFGEVIKMIDDMVVFWANSRMRMISPKSFAKPSLTRLRMRKK